LMTLKYIWRSFQPRLSFPRPFLQSLACFRVARSPSNSWASCTCSLAAALNKLSVFLKNYSVCIILVFRYVCFFMYLFNALTMPNLHIWSCNLILDAVFCYSVSSTEMLKASSSPLTHTRRYNGHVPSNAGLASSLWIDSHSPLAAVLSITRDRLQQGLTVTARDRLQQGLTVTARDRLQQGLTVTATNHDDYKPSLTVINRTASNTSYTLPFVFDQKILFQLK